MPWGEAGPTQGSLSLSSHHRFVSPPHACPHAFQSPHPLLVIRQDNNTSLFMPSPLTGLTVVAPGSDRASFSFHPACGHMPSSSAAPRCPSPPPSPRTLRNAAALADVIVSLWGQLVAAFGGRKAVEEEECECEEEEESPAPLLRALTPALPSSAALASAYKCAALPLPPPATEGRLTVRDSREGGMGIEGAVSGRGRVSETGEQEDKKKTREPPVFFRAAGGALLASQSLGRVIAASGPSHAGP